MSSTELLQINDDQLEDEIDAIFAAVQAGSELRLFTNDFQPEPDSVLGAFTEAAYDTYADVDLTDTWQGPFRDEPGVWTIQTEIEEFPPPTSGGPFTIYGWYVTKGGNWLWGAKFETPVVLSVGGDPLRLRVFRSQYSGIIHAERVCT